jgi:phasin
MMDRNNRRRPAFPIGLPDRAGGGSFDHFVGAAGALSSTQQQAEQEPIMTDTEQGRRTAQKGAAMAREGTERMTRAAEQGARDMQRSYTAAFDNVRDVQRKLIDIAQEHMQATFDFARDVTSVGTPADMVELWSSYARKQFEMLSSQSRELTDLSHSLAADAAQPMKRAANQFAPG